MLWRDIPPAQLILCTPLIGRIIIRCGFIVLRKLDDTRHFLKLVLMITGSCRLNAGINYFV